MKSVAIVQSNYIPWKGYFDLIGGVDHFVLYDDVQYTTYSWRNRNRIKTPTGLQWLTVPIWHTHLAQTIQETRVADTVWPKKHWHALEHNYSRAPFFRAHRDFFEELYLNTRSTHLSEVNFRFLRAICGLLGIQTEFSRSGDYRLAAGKIERVVDLCRQVGADVFLSGPTARPYINEPLFTAAGIRVAWMDYGGYPEYPQRFCPPFVHEVSIVDLIFNVGAADAPRYMLRVGAAADRSGPAGPARGQAS